MTAESPPVTVLGLGAMGRSLARAFLAAGHPTTVWNRSPGRTAALVDAGATAASTAAEAVDPHGLIVICLLDRAGVEEVVAAVGAGWRNTAVANLTSSTPGDARAVAALFTTREARYLDGTIMVPTKLIGTPDAHVLYSGDSSVFSDHEATLASLGGPVELLGADPGLAATYDLGMLDIFFNGMTAFLHAAALVGADDVSASTFLPHAKRMLALLDETFDELASDVDRSEHDGTEDNLVMELAFLDHIVNASRERGLDTSVPGTPRALVDAAVTAGHGADSFSRVIDVLRHRHPAPPSTAPTRSAVRH